MRKDILDWADDTAQGNLRLTEKCLFELSALLNIPSLQRRLSVDKLRLPNQEIEIYAHSSPGRHRSLLPLTTGPHICGHRGLNLLVQGIPLRCFAQGSIVTGRLESTDLIGGGAPVSPLCFGVICRLGFGIRKSLG